MPTLSELQSQIRKSPLQSIRLGVDEELIVDDRGKLRPGQLVERKLTKLLSRAEEQKTNPSDA